VPKRAAADRGGWRRMAAVRGLKQQDRGRHGSARLCPALGAVVGPAETAGGLRTDLPMAPAGAALTSSDWVPTLPRRWRVGCRAD